MRARLLVKCLTASLLLLLVLVWLGLVSRILLRGQHIVGLVDTGGKVVEIAHHLLDVVDGQVDEHTSDLGGSGWLGKLLHEVVEQSTSLVLVVGVLLVDSTKDLVALDVESLLDGQVLLVQLLGLLHLLWVNLLLLHLLWVHLLLTAHVWMHHLLVVTVWLLATLSGTSVLHVLSALHAVLTWVASDVSTLAHHVAARTLATDEGWEVFDEQLEVVLDVLLVGEARPVGTLVVLGSEVLEVISVSGSFVVHLSDFLDLVVVDGQGLALEGSVVELLLCCGSLIRLFETDKGIEFLALSLWMEFQALDFSVGSEQVLQTLLSDVFREALHVQVASLLRALVLDGLLEALLLAVSLLQGFLDVELLVLELNSVDLVGSIELLDGSLSTLWSILAVALVLRVIADESI